jgi:hypothetical protein
MIDVVVLLVVLTNLTSYWLSRVVAALVVVVNNVLRQFIVIKTLED